MAAPVVLVGNLVLILDQVDLLLAYRLVVSREEAEAVHVKFVVAGLPSLVPESSRVMALIRSDRRYTGVQGLGLLPYLKVRPQVRMLARRWRILSRFLLPQIRHSAIKKDSSTTYVYLSRSPASVGSFSNLWGSGVQGLKGRGSRASEVGPFSNLVIRV